MCFASVLGSLRPFDGIKHSIWIYLLFEPRDVGCMTGRSRHVLGAVFRVRCIGSGGALRPKQFVLLFGGRRRFPMGVRHEILLRRSRAQRPLFLKRREFSRGALLRLPTNWNPYGTPLCRGCRGLQPWICEIRILGKRLPLFSGPKEASCGSANLVSRVPRRVAVQPDAPPAHDSSPPGQPRIWVKRSTSVAVI